jgi:SAM-dependent methyltransferase
VTDRQTLEVYEARAREYATRFGKDETADTQLQHFLDLLPPGAQVLDLGCGPGRSAGIIAAAGHKVTATDASAEMVALAARQPGVTARQEAFRDLSGTELYDGVWANFSLLHADRSDLPRHIATIAGTLKRRGIFHIGMKTGTGTARDRLGRRYTYVTDTELTGLLDAAGLHPLVRWTGSSAGLSGDVEPWIVIQARKDG